MMAIFALILTIVNSAKLEGNWIQVQRAPNVRYLPDAIHDGRVDRVRPSILQGMHHDVVQSPPQLSCL